MPGNRRLILIVAGLCLFTLALWLPALTTPWWGDDYFFLQTAHKARLAQEPWWRAFWPDVRNGFWRPLSIDTYWRIAEDTLAANAVWAHIFNYLLWLCACASVGLLAWVLARRSQWHSPLLLAILTAAIYGMNGTHLLALHWASAANSAILVCWMALAMAAWLAASTTRGNISLLLYTLVPPLQLLALLSKESAILLPLLLPLVSIFCGDLRPGRAQIVSWLACLLVCGLWLLLFKEFTGPRHQGYALNLGSNLVRNTLALTAWLLNIPREALRLLMTGQIGAGAIWALAAALPMLGFIALCVGLQIKRLPLHQWLATLVFIPCAYAPYFLLASQSYEYYAAVALILPIILLASGMLQSPRPLLAACLVCMSCLANVQCSRLLDYPSLLGRTLWAEQQLTWLESQEIPTPLVVTINNPHQFYAIGVAGLAWRLGLSESDILALDHCPTGTLKRLVQDGQGNFKWENCPSQTN